MLTKVFKTLLLMVSLCGLPLGMAAELKSPWIHLEVKEGANQTETVKVNLPLSMLEVALNVVRHEQFHDGKFAMHSNGKISVADIKNLWSEMRKTGDAEFVSVEKADETVRLARNGDFLLVKVTGSKKRSSNVDLKLPIAVVDALFSGQGEELNLKAALQSLQQANLKEILTVNDSHTQVKLWID